MKRCGADAQREMEELASVAAKGWVASLNANLFAEAAQFTQLALEVSYDGETPEGRRKRREENWTPALWEIGES
jgi:hypothetical protein